MKELTIVIFSFLVFSCTSKYKKEVDVVSELQVHLIGMETTFIASEKEKVDNAIKTYHSNMAEIKRHYIDTVNFEFVNLVNKYKGIKKEASGLDQDHQNIASNLITMKQQLSNLKIDLNNELIPKDSVSYFIDEEDKKIISLKEDISSYVLSCEYIIDLDDSLSEKVSNLLISSK